MVVVVMLCWHGSGVTLVTRLDGQDKMVGSRGDDNKIRSVCISVYMRDFLSWVMTFILCY